MNACKNNISYTHGDTFNIPIEFESFENGDKLRFQVAKCETDALLINKTYSVLDNKTVNVSLSEKEIKRIPLGEYIYRMTIIGVDGVIKTHISGRLDVIWGTDSDGDKKNLFITNAKLMDEINSKLDKDERFKLAYVSDAGGSKVLFIGNSNDSQGVDFYSKEQTDAALDNKIDKSDRLYLAELRKRSNSSTGKKWDLINFVNTSDVSKKTEIIVPSYISDLENDGDFSEEFIVAFTGDIENLTSQIRYSDIYSAYNQGKRIYGIWNHVDTGDLLFELVKFGEDGLGYEGIVGMGIPFVFEHKSTTSDGKLHFIKIKVYQAMGGTGTSFEVVESDISSGSIVIAEGEVDDSGEVRMDKSPTEIFESLFSENTMVKVHLTLPTSEIMAFTFIGIQRNESKDISFLMFMGSNVSEETLQSRSFILTANTNGNRWDLLELLNETSTSNTYTKKETDALLNDKVDVVTDYSLSRLVTENPDGDREYTNLVFADNTSQSIRIPTCVSDLPNDANYDSVLIVNAQVKDDGSITADKTPTEAFVACADSRTVRVVVGSIRQGIAMHFILSEVVTNENGHYSLVFKTSFINPENGYLENAVLCGDVTNNNWEIFNPVNPSLTSQEIVRLIYPPAVDFGDTDEEYGAKIIDISQLMNNPMRHVETGGIYKLMFKAPVDADWGNPFIGELSFNSGSVATLIEYDTRVTNHPITWVGNECSTANGKSTFAPVTNKHYDIIFYHTNFGLTGIVNGYELATSN